MGVRSFFTSCFGSKIVPEKVIFGVSASDPQDFSESDFSAKSPQVEINNKHKDLALTTTSSIASFSPRIQEVSTLAAVQSARKPTVTKALMVVSKQTYGIAIDIPYPIIEYGGEVIVRSKAVGLNPIDWKTVDYNFCLPSFPWITGREVAGVVEAVGKDVMGVKVGDRVWSSTYYRDRRAGTFQQYVTVPQHTVLPLPENISFPAGASLGVAALTAAMTLWKWLKIPLPLALSHSPGSQPTAQYILIWGGSSITGQFAIQLARASNLTVVTITSAKTKALATRLGAQHVITRDGKSNENIVGEIRGIVGNDLRLAIDIVGNETAAACLQALSDSENKKVILAPLAFLRAGEVIPQNVEVANVEMKTFILDSNSRVYAEVLNQLVAEGKVLTPDIEILSGGLGRIEDGLDMLKKGDRGGKKLVVEVE